MSERAIVCSVDHRPGGCKPGARVFILRDEDSESEVLARLAEQYPACDMRVTTETKEQK